MAAAAPKQAVALRHVGFEDLGCFAPVLHAQGYEVRYREVGQPGWNATLGDAAVLFVLGGPVSVAEPWLYPWLHDEIALVADRLAAGAPTVGICLGAQIMAAALGADVAPMGVKEIGFAPIDLLDAGRVGPLRHLAGVPLLHWHGDMAALPAGAAPLARTTVCANQAFAVGDHSLAMQFHPEVDAIAGIEPWLIGHALELAAAGLDPRDLRTAAATGGEARRRAGQAMLAEWLARSSA